MSTEEIDFKALFEQVQRENEALRLDNLKRHNVSIDWLGVLDSTCGFIQDHYTVIVVAIMASYYLVRLGLDTYRIVRSRHV